METFRHGKALLPATGAALALVVAFLVAAASAVAHPGPVLLSVVVVLVAILGTHARVTEAARVR